VKGNSTIDRFCKLLSKTLVFSTELLYLIYSVQFFSTQLHQGDSFFFLHPFDTFIDMKLIKKPEKLTLRQMKEIEEAEDQLLQSKSVNLFFVTGAIAV